MKIIDWIKDNISKLNTENYISIHLDELNINKDYLSNGINILKQVNNELEKYDSINSSLKLDLQFELISENNVISTVPRSYNDLINSIDEQNSPELIISYRQSGYLDYIPEMEYYMSPIPFDIQENNDKLFKLHYSEYRTVDELLENEIFSRWLNLSLIFLNK